jgi:acetylornithine deacetylase/succinyl-diaminopimelate desuccinylase-like protein
MLPAAVQDYLSVRREEHLDRLIELLKIPSVANAGGQSCRHAAEWLAAALSATGMEVLLDGPADRPAVLGEYRAGEDCPTVLWYGHYDVQPPDPLELWESPPFEPIVRDGWIHARGSDDDKGQVFAHLIALEALLGCGGLGLNVRVLLEGEEEIGSPSLPGLIEKHRRRISADAAVISDSHFFAEGTPSLTVALRGLMYAEITLTGPSSDLHSGVHGGAVANPATALAALLAGLHDENGRVTLEGFYDEVRPLAEADRLAWESLPFDERALAASIGVDALAGGERDLPALHRRWARPSLDVNGLHSGYTGPGAKTIIPARASAKLSARLVCDQDPEAVGESLRRYVERNTPPGCRSEVEIHPGARPVTLDADTPHVRAARAAMAEAFGVEPVLVRSGASVPVTELLQRQLGLDAAMMGLGLPQDNIHAPNERMKLDQIWLGSEAAAAFYLRLADPLQ